VLSEHQAKNGPLRSTGKGRSEDLFEETRICICPDGSDLETRFANSTWNRVGEVLEAMLGAVTQSVFKGVEDKAQRDLELLERVSMPIDSIRRRRSA